MMKRSGKQSKVLSGWAAIALGWGAAVALAACAVDNDGALGEREQQNRFDPPHTTLCGDHICNGSETLANCPEDCTSPPPPPACGDGFCNGTETNASCPADCPPGCGDGVCNGSETATSCPIDCAAPACGDCICSAGETTSCPWDCDVPGFPTWCLDP
jgi:hypothetical protein